ncbi:hypothetical protein KHS38_01345 [Mucilaginibacter sp. Bleaf8]|uniref:hypothetical protein n=1 Tax=Mucilaginibacter sp. Bleaf8 TaxID=2834430 RepID=UPI001BCD843B|nr:hypothetical protein [Mucilaginibacter sp. Bleaf8]MBS7563035.1 hypothetical protein [Mucilaginibacter sp. Bleaf8]
MRNLLLVVIIIVFTVGCNRSQKTEKPGSLKFDTITLKDNEVLFISPSDKNIKELKKKHGKGFYTIADDANNYFSEASSYLDSQKTPYKNYDDDKIIVFKKNNKTYKIPKYKSPWYLIFYKDEKYELLDLISIKDRYPKFFKDKTQISPSDFGSKKIIDSIAE